MGRIGTGWRIGGLVAAAVLALAPAFADEAGCLDCHDAEGSPALHTVFDGHHRALAADGAAACTACHGPSASHDRRGRKALPDIRFGGDNSSSPEEQNAACSSCHEGGQQLLWAGSAHQQENLACSDCHSGHAARDRALDEALAQQSCTDCHTTVQAQLHLPSRHPIAEGKTACVDCHNPHGAAAEAALHQPSANDNCNSCHQDKRGPFLWEHEPVGEDCGLCHRPHGSVHEQLLVARGPALCQQCHSAAFHPSVPYGGETLGDRRSSQNLAGSNCLNCHSQVHGSNHPSGARLTR